MRILVTGASGFVGGHCIRDLKAAGHVPVGFDARPVENAACEMHVGDLRNPEQVEEIVRRCKPDAGLHLGGIAFVPTGWTDPDLVMSVNVGGTIHVLEAFRAAAPRARLLVVSSAEVYGRVPRDAALTEDDPPFPANPYAVSKLAADLMALLYARRYQMPVLTARPGNHFGPGQSAAFVATAFAEQLVDIAGGRQAPVMRVGNLEGERDFSDVRDVVRAYRLLIERGRAGAAYNIASGRLVKIREILDQLAAIVGVKPAVEVDPSRYRPTDKLPSIGISRIRQDTGWTPEIPLEQSLRDIVQDCRSRRKQ